MSKGEEAVASMVEVNGPERKQALSLLAMLDYPQSALSIVEGRSPGRVFVDDFRSPRVVLASEPAGNLFLAGEPGQEMAQVVSRLLRYVLIPEKIASGRTMCYMDYWPVGWDAHVPAMLPEAAPKAYLRCLYSALVPPESAALSALEALAQPPEGCAIREVGTELLDGEGLGNLGEVLCEIRKMWGDIDAFLSAGAGYCAIQGNDITSWCLTEYPREGSCGIGVETVEAYQRRGHATAASAACIVKCLRAGMKPYWDLWANNEPSRKLAEKLLLKRIATYPAFFFRFDRGI